MEYFIYKDEKDKKAIIDEMKKIRKYIYDDEDISCLDKSIKLVSYNEVYKDRSLVNFIAKNMGSICQRGEDCYFRCYGERSKEAIDHYKETIMIHMMYNNSGSKEETFLPIFYPYVYAYYISSYLGKKEKSGINEELGHLGVLTFANGINPYDENTLIIIALHNREYIRRIFDRVISNGSYEAFANKCKSFVDHQNTGTDSDSKQLDEDFNSILETLKKMFYGRMNEMPDIPEEEKTAMIDNYDEVYDLLKKQYSKENKTIKKAFTI